MADRKDILNALYGLARGTDEPHLGAFAADLADAITEKSEIHLHGITPVVLNPGDRVLVAVESGHSLYDIAVFKAYLVKAFPDVEITVLSGVESVTVQRAEVAK